MEKSKFMLLIIAITTCSFLLHTCSRSTKNDKPRAKTEILQQTSNSISSIQLASAIGESALKEKFGNDVIENQKPFQVSLKNDVWIIDGQKDNMGNNSHIEICKSTGSVLAISFSCKLS